MKKLRSSLQQLIILLVKKQKEKEQDQLHRLHTAELRKLLGFNRQPTRGPVGHYRRTSAAK